MSEYYAHIVETNSVWWRQVAAAKTSHAEYTELGKSSLIYFFNADRSLIKLSLF